ncbi:MULTISPECIES: sensor histidine kinase [Reichenbachiella]|uniref:sensor histidine kinase n=1 Tax=Reichenbachiella TaxID=156993 RepID=UPI000E6C2E26|nr:PAS domain-containing sensor histidine kinase [Reichenbachiella sp. MSK19-1]MBU2913120.1 PAS domain-containing sensor histidine kinase [Reichenbachiella agariperforans]
MNNSDAYREIYYSCVEGILVVSEGKIILANPQCESLFGYDHDEMLGMVIEDFVPMEIRKQHREHYKGFVSAPVTKQMGVGRDLTALRKDGSTFPVEISLNPATIDGKNAVIAHIIDITVRKQFELTLKRSEEQLIEYAAELEKRVQERTQELADVVTDLKKTNEHLEEEVKERIKAEKEANKALSKEKELNELKSRFVSMASHEFRTPLSTILSSASLIGKYTTTETQPNRDKHIGRIKSNVTELTSILNEFLSLEKIDAGKMRVELAQLEMVAFLDELSDELATVAKDGQDIVLETIETDCIMNTDPLMLRQVMTNLISNAIKYSSSQIRVVLTDLDKTVELSVIDQGIGIPENDQKHLFDKFFRAHNSHHIQGTGLGLNIVRKYLDLLEADIRFESEEGTGSTFTIILNK